MERGLTIAAGLFVIAATIYLIMGLISPKNVKINQHSPIHTRIRILLNFFVFFIVFVGPIALYQGKFLNSLCNDLFFCSLVYFIMGLISPEQVKLTPTSEEPTRFKILIYFFLALAIMLLLNGVKKAFHSN